MLVVDEAHRLNEKSGLYKNLGDNQVRELIDVADVTVFFLDEDQRVTLADIGTSDEIVLWAEEAGAEVEELELRSGVVLQKFASHRERRGAGSCKARRRVAAEVRRGGATAQGRMHRRSNGRDTSGAGSGTIR